MILINKGREPEALTKYRKQSFASYDGCDKAPIRKKLLAEQGYLCAYCMRRIDERHMKIEHWKPEAILSEADKLDYHNMLAVCLGHLAGEDGKYDTCDSKKGETEILVDPRCEQHIELIAYRKGSGEIYSDDERINEDLNITLNLNCYKQYLPQNRKAALNRLIHVLSEKQQQGTWSKSLLQKVLNLYETADADGKKKEYAGILIWYLKKQLT